MTDNHEKCNALLLSAVTKNKKIQKLIDSIESLGCAIPKDFFVCRFSFDNDSTVVAVGHILTFVVYNIHMLLLGLVMPR